MKKQRSLKTQLNYAVTKCERFGHSKHSDKSNPNIDTTEGVYSIKSADALRDTINNFANYMKENYPKVKYVRDLTAEHFNGWINERERAWSNKTYDNMVSRVVKLEKLLNRTYNLDLNLHSDLKKRDISRQNKEEIRNIKMDEKDYEKLHDRLLESRSHNAFFAAELTKRCGLRANEASHLRFANIDIDNQCLHITEGAKNGKKRDVPIREKDLEFFWNLKYDIQSNSPFVCGSIKTDSINRTIRRAMEEIGIDGKYIKTSEHAIRKLYASERFSEELERTGDEKAAWCIVQKELGHTDRFRPELFRTYIKT